MSDDAENFTLFVHPKSIHIYTRYIHRSWKAFGDDNTKRDFVHPKVLNALKVFTSKNVIEK